MSSMPIDEPGPAPARLAERHLDQTRRWILQAATEVLEADGVPGLTNAAIAERAGVSERTVYRHFSTREALLDELAAEVTRRIGAPEPPAQASELPGYARELFTRFEAVAALTRAALHPDVFARIREGKAAQRWSGIARLIDAAAPHLPAAVRRRQAANVRFLLSASTWHYYRAYFGFDAEEAIACIEQALRQQLGDVPRGAVSRSKASAPAPTRARQGAPSQARRG